MIATDNGHVLQCKNDEISDTLWKLEDARIVSNRWPGYAIGFQDASDTVLTLCVKESGLQFDFGKRTFNIYRLHLIWFLFHCSENWQRGKWRP